ncbi:MAG: adenylate kinase [Candidatus Aenigmatarchaeota archaeon]
MRQLKIIILGQQGSGKGAYAQWLVDKYGYAHISTGDLLREEIKKGSELGLKVRDIVNSGGLVSDELISKVLENRLKKEKKGFILDGYPRTIAQAKILEDLLSRLKTKIDLVINLVVSDELSIERITNRRICRECGWICNIKFMPPKKPGICDKCGGELYQREDDKEEIVKKRIEEYHKQIYPVIEDYKRKGLLHDINSNRNYEEVVKDIEELLKRFT